MSDTTDPRGFAIAAFLVVAARELVDDPPLYGPFRIIDAVDRLILEYFDDEFLDAIRSDLGRGIEMVEGDHRAYVEWLDELATRFAIEAKRRNLDE